MIREEIVIDLGRIGRTNDHGQSDEIFIKEIELWGKINERLNSKSYTHDGVSAEIYTDWSPVIEELKKQQTREREFNKLLEENGEAAWEIYRFDIKEPKVKFLVSIQGKNEVSEYKWYPRFFVEKYLYDIFLIANLSLPGSCEFLNVRFISEREKESERYLLSSYNFEEALYNQLDGVRPSPICLPVSSVIDWYDNLDTGIKQKAESPIEKAIFSLLHLCKSDVDETSVVWLFHALEAIYGTRVGEGFSNLINRLSILLQLDSKEKAKTKKKLRSMYDYRSSIVHGGYQVHHPLRNEVIDKRLNEDWLRTYELFQDGFNLVVLSIQIMIQNGWYGIEVKESLIGVNAPNKQSKSDV
ncbi:HEPN domain-containing protein [Shewanella aegiceratis]|uniref:HEPN domain-containing protein n=1 Tax=Shewanella aegiceratis TaxID=2864203 RepID=UPI001C658C10|nr:HEPN domain-containing protein [Shewanella aegiceratis]QYJ82011.1 hypothetical protein K0H80_17205 [Shewanella aegiceratis]